MEGRIWPEGLVFATCAIKDKALSFQQIIVMHLMNASHDAHIWLLIEILVGIPQVIYLFVCFKNVAPLYLHSLGEASYDYPV